MGRATYEALGVETVTAQKMSDAFENLDRKSIATLAQYRDPDVPAAENTAYLAKVRELGAEFQKKLEIQMAEIRREDSSGSS
jgi:CPA2 family monovalent cation:H+ antiporter-2